MAKRAWRRMSEVMRRSAIRYAASGWTVREIAEELKVGSESVRMVIRPMGGVFRVEDWMVPEGQLSLEDRAEIWIGLRAGESCPQIAERCGLHRGRVWREVDRNGGREAYRPLKAHRAACERSRRPKVSKLETNPVLCAEVIAGLEKLWSPEQIAARLRVEYPDDPDMWVSHETIYKSLFIQGRGELRAELTRCLRTGRTQRKGRGTRDGRGKIPNMVMISERPGNVEDRSVPGHWEGDLIIGKNSASAIGTLVERTTRYVLLLHLPEDHTAESVRQAAAAAIAELPEHLRRSLTWDQGREMAQHTQFSVDTGVDVYFCDPHSPWQRGTNENTNGLLRQYFPKGTDLSVHDADHLAEVAHSLNTRPRKTLEWQTPAQALDALLVAATD